jgi:3-oxoacyl-[acyl-carrier-protein] synthase II
MKGKKNMEKVVVTGMGFALPGEDGRICASKDDFWKIISNGTICSYYKDRYYGWIAKTEDELRAEIKNIPPNYLKNYNRTHLLALISLQEACEDAKLEMGKENFDNAAVLTARSCIASCYTCYREFMDADPEEITPQESLKMFNRIMLSATMTDACNVQAAVLQSGGPVYSISCGCAGSNQLIGIARGMIESGEVDCVVVSGVDTVNEDAIQLYDDLVDVAEKTNRKATFSAPPTKLLIRELMRPYDKNAKGYNGGEGSATIILESKTRAKNRNAHIYGEIVSQATVRGNETSSAVTIDESGKTLAKAIYKCLSDKVDKEEINYINGGAQGDKIIDYFEFNGIKDIYGEKAKDIMVSCQEACFGHNASVLGVQGVVSSLLMMDNREVCPTAGCLEPDDASPFDIVAGKKRENQDINYALSLNYEAGSVCSALLLKKEV